MKSTLLFLILIASVTFLFAGKGYDVTFSKASNDTYDLKFNLADYQFSNVSLKDVTYTRILFEGSIVSKEKGYASLPFIHASLQLGTNKNVSLLVTGKEYKDYYLEYPLVPSRGVIYRDQDPDEIPFEINPASIVDELYPADIARQTDPFIIRDVRGITIYVNPFRYNAAKNILRVYSSVTVQLTENNTLPINPLMGKNKILSVMNGIYRSVFINYQSNRDDLTIGEAGDILVICTSRDETAIDSFIEWKRQKGFLVTKEVVATGTNVKSLIQNQYDANNNLLYVQLVGDWPDIKSETLGYAAPMDPQLGCVVGSDEFADICIGRFSTNNENHVTIQVNKVIDYEKTPEVGGLWYDTFTGLASNQGPGDDNELDYEHIDVIYYDKLDPFTYNSFYPIYDPSAYPTMVNNAINTGTSIINYCGHGSSTSWITSGFSNSNVANLTNEHKLPFIISVACNNGDFHQTYGDCFAETWLKKENGGAVMFLGASISQPWDPPMRGQDYFMDILIGGYDYTAHSGQSGINTTEQRTTVGAIIFNGLTLMCIESGEQSDWETAKTWNTFGDPSMQVRTAPPEPVNLSNTLIMTGVPFKTMVTSNSIPVEGAMVTLSEAGEYFHGVTDATGSVSITHTLAPGYALVVVTGFNMETFYQTITVIHPSGAYVVFEYHEVNDRQGNGNNMIDYAETVKLSVALTNVGSDDANNVIATLSTNDVYTTINDNQENHGNILAGETVFVADAFEISMAGDVPDLHTIIFDITTEADNWTSSFMDVAHAPILKYGSYVISDPTGNNNGKLDPGETAELQITIENIGSSATYNVIGELIANSTYIDISQSSMNYGQIDGGSNGQQYYEIASDAATPPGHSVSFDFNMTANYGISGTGNFYFAVGQIPVLIIDMDGNNNSASKMITCLDNLSIGSEYTTAIPTDLELYASVFLCLGIYPDNHSLLSSEGQQLADYLNKGGNLYMEGGETWAYDQTTPVHGLFNISGLDDGISDMSNVIGQAGTMCDGMDYVYSGDNNYIDHLEPIGSAVPIFRNSSPDYGCGIAYSTITYKTIGSSFEFGGLIDGTSTKDLLMYKYLIFFGIDVIWRGTDEIIADEPGFSVYPNPVTSNVYIAIRLIETANVRLELYNLGGQKVYTIIDSEILAGNHVIDFKINSIFESGIYFLRYITNSLTKTQKLVILH